MFLFGSWFIVCGLGLWITDCHGFGFFLWIWFLLLVLLFIVFTSVEFLVNSCICGFSWFLITFWVSRSFPSSVIACPALISFTCLLSSCPSPLCASLLCQLLCLHQHFSHVCFWVIFVLFWTGFEPTVVCHFPVNLILIFNNELHWTELAESVMSGVPGAQHMTQSGSVHRLNVNRSYFSFLFF